jgi:hypothetical protein
MSKLETGRTFVGPEIIGKLANALDAEPMEFLTALACKAGRRK